MTQLIKNYCPECNMPCNETVVDGACTVCDVHVEIVFSDSRHLQRTQDHQEFVDLVRDCSAWGTSNDYPASRLYPQYTRLRDLGQRFFDHGGFTEMRHALFILDTELAEHSDQVWSRFVEFTWRDIGGWMP